MSERSLIIFNNYYANNRYFLFTFVFIGSFGLFRMILNLFDVRKKKSKSSNTPQIRNS